MPDISLQEIDVKYDCFHYFWNMHTCSETIYMPATNAILQIKTNSNLMYTIFMNDHSRMIGLSRILNYEDSFPNVLVYQIDECLLDFKFARNSILKFPIVVLAQQKIHVDIVNEFFEKNDTHEQYTLHYDFNRFSDRKLIGNGKSSVDIAMKNTALKITIPEVEKIQEANFWVHLTMNSVNIPLVSWLRPQNITIYPNIHSEYNLCIGDFNPQRVSRNQPLWIHGIGFNSKTCRVVIGGMNVVIYSCSSTLIKCIVPNLGENNMDVFIQVANTDLFMTAHNRLKYMHDPNSNKRKHET
jgi:hypothetical protein